MSVITGKPTEIQRGKVLKALEIYSVAGSLTEAATAVGLASDHLYHVFEVYPEIERLYRNIQKRRSHRFLDESYVISTTETDPRLAQARATIRMNLAKMLNPGRYSDKLQIEVSQKPDLSAALAARYEAISIPDATPKLMFDAQDAEFSAIPDESATDIASDDGAVDPFEGL